MKKIEQTSKLELLRYNALFQEHIAALRASWGIPTGGFNSPSDYSKWEKKMFSDKNNVLLVSDIQAMRHELKLNPIFDSLLLWSYIARAERDLGHMQPQDKLWTQLKKINDLGLEVVVHNLNASTTREDWIELWSKVKEFKNFLPQKETFKRSRDMENEEIAKFIYEQHQAGIKHRDIALNVKEKWRLTTVTCDAQWVSKQLERFRKKIEKDT